jgi:hypothetical protein
MAQDEWQPQPIEAGVVVCCSSYADDISIAACKAWITEKGLTFDDVRIAKPRSANCISVITKREIFIR